MFYGALAECPLCGGNLICDNEKRFVCGGEISEWCSCVFSTKSPPRKEEPIKLPDSVMNSAISDVSSIHKASLHGIVFSCNIWLSFDVVNQETSRPEN